MFTFYQSIILTVFFLGCSTYRQETVVNEKKTVYNDTLQNCVGIKDTTAIIIHIFVALCDNKYQGIVPVPPKIGNGQDPVNNLYWGCSYGIKSYFKKSKQWQCLSAKKIDDNILERVVFKHRQKNCYLIADAYNGKNIRNSIVDFLKSSCGQKVETLTLNGTCVGIAGNSRLLAYIGHDGLMDFKLNESFVNNTRKKRDVIVLACYSKRYFGEHLNRANVNPVLWSTGLMAPEAYIIHGAIEAYLANQSNSIVREKAASAYSAYQKCSKRAAQNLLVAGW